MNTQPAFGFQELFTHIIGDMAKAICERNGETKQQQFARSQAAVHTIMGFLPRDAIEAMIAGHCVMFHELMTDSVRDTLRGETDTMRRATRSSIVAMDKAFGTNLARLERYQLRPSEGHRDATGEASAELPVESPVTVAAGAPAEVPAEAPMELPVEAHVKNAGLNGRIAARTGAPTASKPAAAAPVVRARGIPTGSQPQQFRPSLGETTLVFQPSAEAIAACRANSEAMAALDAGDPERFARAMGLEMPSQAYLDAAAAPGSPFDRTTENTPSPGTVAAPRAYRSGDADSADGGKFRVVLEDTADSTTG